MLATLYSKAEETGCLPAPPPHGPAEPDHRSPGRRAARAKAFLQFQVDLEDVDQFHTDQTAERGLHLLSEQLSDLLLDLVLVSLGLFGPLPGHAVELVL